MGCFLVVFAAITVDVVAIRDDAVGDVVGDDAVGDVVGDVAVGVLAFGDDAVRPLYCCA